jgi:hypothetical protein
LFVIAAASAAGARLDSSAAAAAAVPSATSEMLCEALGVELDQLAAIDREGRALITDHGPFIIINLYGACRSSNPLLYISNQQLR